MSLSFWLLATVNTYAIGHNDVASLIQFGRATHKKMIQNLIWATAYDAITLPLATGFVPGVVITPAIGAVFMSLSTIIVAINAQTLKFKK